MFKSVQSSITKLFWNERMPEHPLCFTWRLIQRRNRPFLLVPMPGRNGRLGLELYSAQRPRAKLWRAALPVLLRTPAAAIFHRIEFRADPDTEIIRFLSEQSGVPARELLPPAIKFGGAENQKARLVLLVCDQTRRPVKVIKVGLDEGGRAATEREAAILEKLPANTLGCIRMTGRLKTGKLSAFATAFFPGDSPEDDAGMEILFQSWINPEPAAPIESLGAWRELEVQVGAAAPEAWRALRPSLAGRRIRSTLHHGDFAPWNIRAVNSQNLQVFDWESGCLRGVPGWDWFHFIIQTSVLARRHSAERVSAELEELMQSPRFEKYAADTGIKPIVKPLALAYLLRHRWVVRPRDGVRQTAELFDFLSARWGLAAQPITAGSRPETSGAAAAESPVAPSILGGGWEQLKSAWALMTNVFWEPTLTASFEPSLPARLKGRWFMALLCAAWVAAVAGLQYFYAHHLLLLPIYAIPCLVAAWNLSRRWGTLFAAAAAATGPLVAAFAEPSFCHADLACWNALMRFILLQTCVFLADRVHGQKDFFRRLTTDNRRPADFAGSWAVVLACTLWFAIVAMGDIYTGPRVVVLPMYLFPAMLITLSLNLRWGAIVALLAAAVSSVDEYTSKFNASIVEVFGWNFVMRFLTLFVIILLLDRFSNGNVLFQSRTHNGGFRPACPD